MRQAGHITAEVLQAVAAAVRPGMKTAELDAIVEQEVRRHGVVASFRGYRGYPASLCVSINDQVVHGIPGPRVIQEGDLVALDVGVIYNGFQGDAAVTVGAGNIGAEARRLMEGSLAALWAGISGARAGAHLGAVSATIQQYVESRGFSVVREYVGHGIGSQMHEDPQVPNFGVPDEGPRLRPGMTLALEPMVNQGDWRTRLDPDGWTVYTLDGSLSAHFEHTIAITDGEAEILTQ